MFRNLLLDKIATTLTSSIEVENGASANSVPRVISHVASTLSVISDASI